jgi:hypothetical protein
MIVRRAYSNRTTQIFDAVPAEHLSKGQRLGATASAAELDLGGAAVDKEFAAGNETAFVRSEKQGCSRRLVGIT